MGLFTARLRGTKNISGEYATLDGIFSDLNTLVAVTDSDTINIIADKKISTETTKDGDLRLKGEQQNNNYHNAKFEFVR